MSRVFRRDWFQSAQRITNRTKVSRSKKSAPSTPAGAKWRMCVEILEARTLLTATPASSDEQLGLLSGHPGVCSCPVCTGVGLAEISSLESAASSPAAGSPLSSLPALSSHPTAAAKLFLDFDGNYEAAWGSWSGAATPAFDQDGDPASFSAGELAAIQEIWARVAEDYAPFNIDVTTIDPGVRTNRVVAAIAIGGGSSDWYGSSAGGVAYVGGFYNSAPNVGFVFENNLGGYPKYVAEAASHEAGHLFGLQHQVTWSGGTLVESYNSGNGSWAPIMGIGYSAPRTTWHNGPTAFGPAVYQDDLSILAGSSNGFGYQSDDFGSSLATASVLPISSGVGSFGGLIGQPGDSDVWSFATGGGPVSFELAGAAWGSNLDAELALASTAGQIMATAAPANSLGAALSATLAAGTYYLIPRSAGDYGNLGQYTIAANLPSVATAPEISLWLDGASLGDGQTVDFGSTAAGTPVSRTFYVTNDGTAALNLTPLNPAALPAGFTLLSNLGAATLSPGQSTSFTVRLDAASSGTFSGAVQLGNTDGDENPFDLALRGSVAAAAGASALYRFDEATGTVAGDASGNGHTAAYVNNPALGLGGAVAGGTAVNLNGINQYVALPAAPFGAYGGAASFETWFNAPPGASGTILGQTNGSAPGGAAASGYVPIVHLGTDGRLRSSLSWHGDVNARLVSPGSTNYNDGQWHHVAVTHAGGVESLYVDGALVAQQALAAIAYAGTYSYFLGAGFTQSWAAGNGGWHFFGGRLDEAAIYQRALTAGEISQHFSERNPPPVGGGVSAAYLFNETSGSTALDASGNGHSGAYVNNPALGQPGAVAGGTAVSLNGVNQYIALPPTPFGAYGGPLSFETWFQAPLGASGTILSQTGGGTTPGGAASAGYVPVLHLGIDGRLRSSLFWHGDVGARLVTPGAASYNDGRWHHVAVSYSEGMESLYVDGALVAQQAAAQVPYAATHNYFLGTGYTAYWSAGNGGWHYFQGQLDEAAIYPRALSAGEVSQHFAAGAAAGTGDLAPDRFAGAPQQYAAEARNAAVDAVVAAWFGPSRSPQRPPAGWAKRVATRSASEGPFGVSVAP